MPSRAALALTASLATLLLAACLPVPDVRIGLEVDPPAFRLAPEAVRVETTWWPAPPAPNAPPEFDRTGVRRSYHPGDEPQLVIVAVPGLFGGAASFDPLARQLVAAAEGVEVWSIDRRANQFEDHEGLERALRERDPSLALRYYLGDADEPARFTPRTADDLRFMAHWGLHVHLRDLHSVVLRAREVGVPIVLMGHSLGAGLASAYAAFRLSPDDGGGVGMDYVDALVLLDGSVGRTALFGRVDQSVSVLGVPVVPSVAELIEGRAAPFAERGVGPRQAVQHLLVALHARLDPDGLAPPELASYPITNRALLGVLSGDTYTFAPAFGVSAGHAVDAAFTGNLSAFLLMGWEGARSRTVVGVAEGAERVTWSDGEPHEALVDLADLALARTSGGSDVSEWYFPLRLLLDVAALDPRLEETLGFARGADVDVPTLAIGAGRGLVQSAAGFQSYVNTRPGAAISTTVLPGYTHADLVMARDNPAVTLVLRWLRSVGVLS
jgi:hypothetical protein